MKLFKKLGLAALVTSLIAGQAIAQSALDEILSDGILKVGTTGDWNPMSVRDTATNKYVGYDIDIMTELAKDLGVELELVPTDWKTLVNGVVAGKYHMTGSASISPPRLKAAGYSDSYISVEILLSLQPIKLVNLIAGICEQKFSESFYDLRNNI